MNKFIIVLILLFFACCKTNKEKIVLFEMKNFSAELENCVCNGINNKWISLNDRNLTIHNELEKFKGNLSDKIIFKNITEVELANIKHETEKIIFSINKPATDSVEVNIQQFLLESNGKWRRVLNMGNFKIPDNNNVCNRIINLGIIAQCK